jgi:hypothetical protein
MARAERNVVAPSPGTFTRNSAVPREEAMSDEREAAARLGCYGALSALAGILLSGPVAMVTVNAVRAQPAWSDARTFIEHYHPIQTLPYVFGFFFVGGCVLLVAGLRGLAGAKQLAASRLGLVVSAVGATLIVFNYVLQTTFVPALIRGYDPAADGIISSLTMVNPASLAWALEMWGYGLLGLGGWLVAAVLDRSGIEHLARWGLVGNGVISLVGTAVTVVRLEWVLTPTGLASYIAWNVYFLATLVLVAIVIRRRARAERAA